MFYKSETLAVVIDGLSAHTSAQRCSISIDWKNFRQMFKERGLLRRLVYFTRTLECEEGEHVAIKPLLDWMDHNGYSTHVKVVKPREDDSHVPLDDYKVPFTLAALGVAKFADHVVLFTGNGCYVELVENMQANGTRVTLIAEKSVCSDALRRTCDTFIDLRDIETTIGRPLEHSL